MWVCFTVNIYAYWMRNYDSTTAWSKLLSKVLSYFFSKRLKSIPEIQFKAVPNSHHDNIMDEEKLHCRIHENKEIRPLQLHAVWWLSSLWSSILILLHQAWYRLWLWMFKASVMQTYRWMNEGLFESSCSTLPV
jgi:hypothetical protein